MEYRVKNGGSWADCAGGTVEGLASGAYEVRYKATDSKFASKSAQVAVTAGAVSADAVIIDYEAETITYDSRYEVSTSEEFNALSILESGSSITDLLDEGVTTLYVRVKSPAGEVSEVPLAARGAAPEGLAATAESYDGAGDGVISGVTTAMEYKVAGSSDPWKACTGSVIEGLSDGVYAVRYAAADGNPASKSARVLISRGGEPTYSLSVTAPAFDAVTAGYAQPAAKALTISNSGNAPAEITSVTVSGSSFVVAGGSKTVPAGGSVSDWTIQPAAGLDAGVYTATVVVSYNDGAAAQASVSFTVNEEEEENDAQTAPGKPVLEDRGFTFIELKALPDNANGAKAQYPRQRRRVAGQPRVYRSQARHGLRL